MRISREAATQMCAYASTMYKTSKILIGDNFLDSCTCSWYLIPDADAKPINEESLISAFVANSPSQSHGMIMKLVAAHRGSRRNSI